MAKDVISGEYFRSKRLANLVDDDFFHWIRTTQAEAILTPTWQRLLSHLIEYDLSRVQEDVLKGVYQQLIDPKDRHDLGEYYTPDWLCERIVSELLPKQGYKSVLDPGCGSGSFLRAVITHFIQHNPEGAPGQRLKLILSNIQGIDIHPVAVTISRATYVLALGKLVNAAKGSIQIPVYLADSLFLPHEVEEDLYQRFTGVEISYGGKKREKTVVIPQMLIHEPETFDNSIAACTVIAEDHAKTNSDTRVSMEKHLQRKVPELFELLEHETILDALWEFTKGLAQLIQEHNDSIWSFIIRNSYRPAMLKERFDFIIGNPPWLSYRYISDPEYQDEIKKRAVEKYRIAPKSQKLFTQMELATVFLAHSMGTFANPTARLGFVMPRGVLSADQHQNLILRKYASAARFKLTGYWDLWEVTPLFNVPACVLFAKRDPLAGHPRDKLPVKEWHGKLPDRDLRWESARKFLQAEDKEGRVIYLGTRAALSTAPGAKAPSKPSEYQAAFKQGATIVPRSCYFVRIKDLDGAIDPDASYWAETDPEQAAEAKKPYDDVRMSGNVEGKFIYTTALSRHLLPYALLTPSPVVLPLEAKEGVLSVVKAGDLIKEGYREIGRWMKKVEEIWQERRGDKADKQSPYQWLDYSGKLESQNLRQRHLVLYNAAGTNACATYFDRKRFPNFVVEHKLYWAAFSNSTEPHYVTAILNSDTANDAIKPFQSTGLMGERDIEKKLLELPIPTFDQANKTHSKLAQLGEIAHEQATKLVRSNEFPLASSLARQRAFMRAALQKELKAINSLVKSLLE